MDLAALALAGELGMRGRRRGVERLATRRSRERGARPSLVVILLPVGDHDPPLGQARELLDVEQLVPDVGVEALDERVLPRRTGI
jgi:hypothetical protein